MNDPRDLAEAAEEPSVMIDRSKTAKAVPKNDRLTIVEHVYFQPANTGVSADQFESKFESVLSSENQQPYSRRYFIGGEQERLDLGWLEAVRLSCLIVYNHDTEHHLKLNVFAYADDDGNDCYETFAEVLPKQSVRFTPAFSTIYVETVSNQPHPIQVVAIPR